MAFNYFWYWRFDWFDIMMHFVGGVAVALFSNALLLSARRPRSSRQVWWLAIIATLVVSSGWEIFEFWLNRYDLVDTLSDLLSAMIGTVAGAAVFTHFRQPIYGQTQS